MRLLFLILSISITGALCMRNNQGDGNADDFGRGDNVRRNKRSSTEIHPGNAGDSERDNSVRPNKRIRKSTNNYQDYLYEDSFGYELLEDDFFEPHLLGTNSLKNTLAKDTSYEDESYEDNSHDANSSDDSFIDGDFSENDSTDDTNFKRKSANHFEKNEKEKTSRKVVAKDRKMRASRKGEKSHLGKFLQAADKKNFNFHIFQYVPGNIVVSKKGKEEVGADISPSQKLREETSKISSFAKERRPLIRKFQLLPSHVVPEQLTSPKLPNTDTCLDAIVLESSDPEVKYPVGLNKATDEVAKVQDDDRDRIPGDQDEDLKKCSSEDIEVNLDWLDLNVPIPETEGITEPASTSLSESEDLTDFSYVPRVRDFSNQCGNVEGSSTGLERSSYPPVIEFPPSNPSSTSEPEAV